MAKPPKLLQLYRFIKLDGHSINMMPVMDQDLLVVRKDYQFKLVDQADFLSCKQYGNTFLCKDRNVIGKQSDAKCF